MKDFVYVLRGLRIGQWVLLGIAALTGLGGLLLGISDNPPAIFLVVIAFGCLAGTIIWNWRSPRKFWILLGFTLLAFPVGVILHNLFYALGTLASDYSILAGLLGFLEVVFFIVAVLMVGPTAAVALIGGIYTSWGGMTSLTLVNRSCRRFKQSHLVSDKKLYRMINLVRQSASGGNLQPLKFVLSNTEEKNHLIFPSLSWAGYLKDWAGPVDGEKPAAYIILLGDTELAKSFQYDAGIASQSITLGATEMGLGACLISSIKRDALRKILSIPEQYEILLVIALGKPAEEVTLEAIGDDGDVKYWRDEKDRHHVPKRGLEELILEL